MHPPTTCTLCVHTTQTGIHINTQIRTNINISIIQIWVHSKEGKQGSEGIWNHTVWRRGEGRRGVQPGRKGVIRQAGSYKPTGAWPMEGASEFFWMNQRGRGYGWNSGLLEALGGEISAQCGERQAVWVHGPEPRSDFISPFESWLCHWRAEWSQPLEMAYLSNPKDSDQLVS